MVETNTRTNMLLVAMCVMMKILEYSSGTLVDVHAPTEEEIRPKRQRKKRKRRPKRGVAGQPRGMTTEEKLSSLHSPESDCNSNNLDSTASYLSNTSSQDVDFIQDNSDYQWFVDYGYRETHQRSILSLSDSYEEGCYDELARDLDTQLAQVDMEDFRAEDILSTLPAMCCQELQTCERRGGEMFASVSGSMMNKFDFDSSLSPQTSSQEEEENHCESMCKSGPLFSPVRESPLCLAANYSVDSLDCEEQDILLTCQANKDNYTIAFEASTIMGVESDCHDTTGESNTSASGTWSSEETRRTVATNMAASDARTTWCKVVTRPRREDNRNCCMRHSTASLPNLRNNRLNQSVSERAASKGCVKLYDVNSSSASGSESSFSSDRHHSRPSLVRLFIKQRGCAMAHSDYATTRTTNNLSACDNRINKNLLAHRNELNNWVTGTETNATETEQQSFADSLIDEVESESVERLSESVSVCSCEASLNASRHAQVTSGNNNNSLERDDIRSAVVAQLRRGTQTHSSTGSASSTTSEPTEVTRVPNHGSQVRNSSTQCPLHCVDASMQTSASLQNKPAPKLADKVGVASTKQPVYVMYPNYTLPDLDFLRKDGLSLDQVFLTPWKFSPGWSPVSSPTTHLPPSATHAHLHKRSRPHSCADIDHLRKKGFSHIRDWESLAMLLPPEYCALLSDIPELKDYKDLYSASKPLFCVTPPLGKTNPTHFSPFPDSRTNVNNSSTSSTGTPPSSGYRGSSTVLTDSSANPSPAPQTAQNPMFVYRYDSVSSESGYGGPPLPKRSISLPEDKNVPPPPRPPLPRGILRNSLENAKLHKNQANKKRHSMFEVETANLDDPELVEVDCKMKARGEGRSLSGSDEGVGGLGVEREGWRPPTPPTTHALRLQQLLELSGDQWDPKDMDILRQQVSRFLTQGRKSVSFADNGEDSAMTPPNSPQSSVNHKPTYQVKTGPSLNETTINEDMEVSFNQERLRHSAKTELVEVVSSAAGKLICHAAGSMELVSSVALSSLCPALYSLLSDGLKSSLETAFGEINNSVWQVVEASAQQGPMTKALNELVLKLNSEDVLTEGVVKFNAFIFGLLNVQGLDVWLSYLRTRESVLRRHYNPDALILCACRGQTNARALSDKLLAALKPLATLNFKLDLLYETRLLHQSLLQLSRLPSSPSHSASGSSSSSRGSWTLRRLMESPPPPLMLPLGDRPRSCVDSVSASSSADLAATARKRWSVNISGKLGQAFDRLGDDTEEEYTDSLEGVVRTSSGEDTSETGGKFRRLQMKWEMLSGKENSSQEPSPHSSPVKSSMSSVSSTAPKSRIPRPVTSPVRPVNFTPTPAPAPTPQTARPPIKKPLTSTAQLRRPTNIPASFRSRDGPVKARISRADAPVKTGPVARPSSLPYRPQKTVENHRRAASSSTVRHHSQAHQPAPTKFVVTLSHRLPSDSGHLAYNEGERLRLVLEVDDTWLLCCRGDAKGLVPRSGVISLPARI